MTETCGQTEPLPGARKERNHGMQTDMAEGEQDQFHTHGRLQRKWKMEDKAALLKIEPGQ